MSDEVVSFLNRDHIVLVTIDRGEIVVTTTAGTTITTIPASAATLGKFVDPPSYYYGATGDLANHVESNFVSIASTPVALSNSTA